ncbi:MAG: FtsX-like permease family protein [Candidatus Hodarchaeota archaeon]
MTETKSSRTKLIWTRKNFRDLWKYKGRSFPIILLIFLSTSVALMCLGFAHNIGLSQAEDERLLRPGDIYINTFPVNASLAETAINQWKNDYDAIVDVQQRIFLEGHLILEDGEKMRVHIIGLPASNRAVVNDIYVEDGSYFTDYSSNNGIFVDKTYLENLGWKKGQQLEVTLDARYSGVAQNLTLEVLQGSVSPEYGFAYIEEMASLLQGNLADLVESMGISYVANFFASLEFLQNELYGAEYYNQFCIRLEDSNNAAEFVHQLKGGYDIDPFVYSTRVYPSMIRDMATTYNVVAWSWAFLVLSVTTLVIYVVTHRFVDEQRGQIGVLKSLGYTRGEVLQLYLNYGLIMTVLGGVPGVFVGFVSTPFITEYIYSIMLFAHKFTTLAWYYSVAVFSLCLGVVLFTSYFAARKAASIPPQEALRAQVTIPVGAEPLLEKIFHRIFKLRLHPLNKFQLRAVFSRPKRSLFTLSGIIASVILIGISLTAGSSFLSITSTQFENDHWDLQVVFSEYRDWSEARLDIIDALGSTSYEILEPFLLDFGSIYNNDQWNDFLFTAYQQDTALKSFSGADRFDNDTSAILSEDIATALGLTKGSDFEIRGRNQTVITLSVQHIIADISRVYIPLNAALRLSFGEQTEVKVNGALIKGPNLSDAQDRIKNLSYVKSTLLKAELMELMQTSFGVMLIPAIGFIISLALVIGSAVVFSMMTINIGERRNDIITFRALGVSNKELIRSLLTETLLIGIVGAIIGNIIGQIAGTVYIEVIYSFVSMPLAKPSFMLPQVVIVTGLVIFEVFIGQFGALRAALRENIANVTREKILG